jgi:hypothetical protein
MLNALSNGPELGLFVLIVANGTALTCFLRARSRLRRWHSTNR